MSYFFEIQSWCLKFKSKFSKTGYGGLGYGGLGSYSRLGYGGLGYGKFCNDFLLSHF